MKFLLDLSLEVDSSEISYEHDLHFVITKIIDGQKVVIELPTVDSYSGEGLKNGKIMEHYCRHGWWLREKTEKNSDQETGVNLALKQPRCWD